MKSAIENIQGLRAVAALSVVFLHTTSPAGLGLFPSFGNFGVDIFFVISGFIISYITEVDPSHFILKRVIRVMPFYWTATLGLFAVGSAAPTLLRNTTITIPLLLHSLAFIPYMHDHGETRPLLGLGWTLNYEMFFYAMFWFAMRINHRHRLALSCIIMAAIMLAIRMSGTTSPVLRFYGDPIILEFMLGVLSFRLYAIASSVKLQPEQRRYAATALLWLAAITFLTLPTLELLARTHSPELNNRALFLGPAGLVLVCALTIAERLSGRTIMPKALTRMGDASYILYLIHPYIIFGVLRVFTKLTPITAYVFEWTEVAVLLVIVTLAAQALYNGFERPLLKYLRSMVFRTPHPG